MMKVISYLIVLLCPIYIFSQSNYLYDISKKYKDLEIVYNYNIDSNLFIQKIVSYNYGKTLLIHSDDSLSNYFVSNNIIYSMEHDTINSISKFSKNIGIYIDTLLNIYLKGNTTMGYEIKKYKYWYVNKNKIQSYLIWISIKDGLEIQGHINFYNDIPTSISLELYEGTKKVYFERISICKLIIDNVEIDLSQ